MGRRRGWKVWKAFPGTWRGEGSEEKKEGREREREREKGREGGPVQ